MNSVLLQRRDSILSCTRIATGCRKGRICSSRRSKITASRLTLQARVTESSAIFVIQAESTMPSLEDGFGNAESFQRPPATLDWPRNHQIHTTYRVSVTR